MPFLILHWHFLICFHRTIDTRQDESILYCHLSNPDPTIQMSKQKLRIIRPGKLRFYVVQVWWVYMICSLSVRFLADRSVTSVLLCCWNSSASSGLECCVFRNILLLYLSYCCFFLLAQTSLVILLWPLVSTSHFYP